MGRLGDFEPDGRCGDEAKKFASPPRWSRRRPSTLGILRTPHSDSELSLPRHTLLVLQPYLSAYKDETEGRHLERDHGADRTFSITSSISVTLVLPKRRREPPECSMST
jgi:hypothetical protein